MVNRADPTWAGYMDLGGGAFQLEPPVELTAAGVGGAVSAVSAASAGADGGVVVGALGEWRAVAGGQASGKHSLAVVVQDAMGFPVVQAEWAAASGGSRGGLDRSCGRAAARRRAAFEFPSCLCWSSGCLADGAGAEEGVVVGTCVVLLFGQARTQCTKPHWEHGLCSVGGGAKVGQDGRNVGTAASVAACEVYSQSCPL